MVTFVLEASSILRFLDDEAGAERVSEVLQLHAAGKARCIMSATHFGEVIGRSFKRKGQPGAERIASRLNALMIEIVSATAEHASRSGIIHVTKKIPYVDSFAVDLASESPSHVLITADFDFKPVEHDIKIEFLPPKPKP